ncbi:CitMHS family transporter [Pontibacter sp. SGAir0037]|uniref:CitMHS family transporter n=1 Tax=Pontibacter sp. SGAir0037 TaxID=2571030 RepID=UPI0010CCE907|nr:citrate:proton symporter [Pontibacter sp. SGAir0037]QCR23913.1 citrate transporter [Pontibacter sp. SGAir0037]
MVALLGLLTILLLLVLVMTRTTSPVVALILVPIGTALLAGFTTEIVDFMTEGIKAIATTAVMFIFAILFFGVLMDAGTFEPIISRLLKAAGGHPPRITLVTAILAMIVHLDGSGAVTFLVTVPAMLPLYDALGMRRTTLATVVALAAGTMNIVPWGGPTIRAATALEVPVTQLFNPMLIPVLCGLATVLGISYWLGMKETKQIPVPIKPGIEAGLGAALKPTKLARPRLLWFNLLLIVLAIVVLISALAPPHLIFMVAFTLAISVNYPNLADQRERVDVHAKAALLMASILFAAGCFTGILKGAGMIDAMAAAAVDVIPASVGNHLALITGVLSMPASLLFDPDSFYFGVLPLLGTTATHFDGTAIEVGRAALLGQMTTGFPVSPLTGATFLLIGLTSIDLADHQRKTIPLAFLVTLVMLLVSLMLGVISF